MLISLQESALPCPQMVGLMILCQSRWHSKSHKTCAWFSCALFPYEILKDLYDLFTRILQGFYSGAGAMISPVPMKFFWRILVNLVPQLPNHNKTQTMCISLWCHRSPLQWRHNERDSVSNHQPHDCLLNRLFRRISKKTPKLRVTGLCAGNSPLTGEFLVQRGSNAEKFLFDDVIMPRVILALPLSSLLALEVVITTNTSASSDNKVGVVTHAFYWYCR